MLGALFASDAKPRRLSLHLSQIGFCVRVNANLETLALETCFKASDVSNILSADSTLAPIQHRGL